MDTTKIFQSFVDDIRKACSDLSPVLKFEDDLKTIETFYPDALKIPVSYTHLTLPTILRV